jgi:hypothetical protein
MPPTGGARVKNLLATQRQNRKEDDRKPKPRLVAFQHRRPIAELAYSLSLFEILSAEIRRADSIDLRGHVRYSTYGQADSGGGLFVSSQRLAQSRGAAETSPAQFVVPMTPQFTRPRGHVIAECDGTARRQMQTTDHKCRHPIFFHGN